MGIHEAPMKEKDNKKLAMIVGSGVLATGLLAASFNSTLAGFVASISNTANGAGLGTLTMQETNSDGTITCNSQDGTNNAASCATINKYGGLTTMKPGESTSTTVNLKNTGTIDATTFTVEAGFCTQQNTATAAMQANGIGSATDFCSKLNVKLVSNTTVLYDGPASDFSSVDIASKLGKNPAVKAEESIPFTFTISTPGDDPATTDVVEGLGNAYQGVTATQVITWKMTA